MFICSLIKFSFKEMSVLRHTTLVSETELAQIKIKKIHS